MPRPMSLAEYRATTKILGEKSALFEHKKEIFEAIGMGLSHEQIHHFLTTQKGLKISVRAVSKWIKTHKKQSSKPIIPSFSPQKIEVQNRPNNGIKKENEVVNQPKVEPVSPTTLDDRALKVREKMGKAADGLPDGLLEMFSHQILNY